MIDYISITMYNIQKVISSHRKNVHLQARLSCVEAYSFHRRLLNQHHKIYLDSKSTHLISFFCIRLIFTVYYAIVGRKLCKNCVKTHTYTEREKKMNLKDNKNNKTTKNTPMTVPYTPGNVREFDSCHGNVGHFTKSRGIVREKISSGKSCLKLSIVSCIFTSIQVFSRSLFCVRY